MARHRCVAGRFAKGGEKVLGKFHNERENRKKRKSRQFVTSRNLFTGASALRFDFPGPLSGCGEDGARVSDGLVLPQTDLARMNVVLGGDFVENFTSELI